MKTLGHILLGIFCISIISCSSPKPIEIGEHKIQATATGPLFTGVNTATADFKIQDLLPEGVDIEQLSSAKIKSIIVRPESESAPEVLSYTTLLSSPEEDMNQFAFLNQPDKTTASLTIAEDQSFIIDMLKDSSQTLVIDFNLKEDWYEDWIFDVVIEWELTITK
jgi:hypothetical protein